MLRCAVWTQGGSWFLRTCLWRNCYARVRDGRRSTGTRRLTFSDENSADAKGPKNLRTQRVSVLKPRKTSTSTGALPRMAGVNFQLESAATRRVVGAPGGASTA